MSLKRPQQARYTGLVFCLFKLIIFFYLRNDLPVTGLVQIKDLTKRKREERDGGSWLKDLYIQHFSLFIHFPVSTAEYSCHPNREVTAETVMD